MQTIVPAQALTMLNSPLAREQAAAFAGRVASGRGTAPKEAVDRAWLLAFGRPITEQETARALKFLEARTLALDARPASQDQAGGKSARAAKESPFEKALTELCLALFNANEFIFVD